MLDSMAKIQLQVAQILEVKAMEAEKSRNWICSHISDASFMQYGEQLKKALEVHDQMLEVIEGMTKLENALARNLDIVLNKGETDVALSSSDGSLFGGFGGLGG